MILCVTSPSVDDISSACHENPESMLRCDSFHHHSRNRQYRRQEQQFQNRCKPILCQEDLHVMELVRSIPLNPLRAGLGEDAVSREPGILSQRRISRNEALTPGRMRNRETSA